VAVAVAAHEAVDLAGAITAGHGHDHVYDHVYD